MIMAKSYGTKPSGTEAEVFNIPKCQFCDKDAEYDASTSFGGSWAYMCKGHWKMQNGRVGLGIGQKLIKINRE